MAITTSPAYPVVDQAVTLTSSTAAGTHQLIVIDTLPSSSAMSAGMVLLDYVGEAPKNALEACEREINAPTVTLDEPGEYAVTLYDIREIPGIPETDSDRGGEYRFEYVATDTGTIHVGAIVQLPVITIDSEGATLQLQINDTTVRAASLVDHTDDAARAMAETAAATAALTALVGQTAATMGNDLVTGVNDLRTNYEAHRILVAGGVHAAADTVNTTDRDDADSIEGAINVLNRLREVILAHQQTTPAAGAWHTEEDWKNVPLTGPAENLAGATVLLADMRERVYEAHRVQVANPATHGAADNVNTLTASTALDDLIVAYLDALVTASPPVLAGEPEGAQDAAANFGFEIQDSD